MKEDSSPKKVKAKKRPSDFEIVRTILQRTHERKIPYLLKNMGEDNDVLFLSSADEEGFVYGAADITIAIIEILDDELQSSVQAVLHKLYGLKDNLDHQFVVNIRDQISELSKTKGETIDCEVESNAEGSVWLTRTDTRGMKRILKFCTAVDSLYHFQTVKTWCKLYRPLLTTTDPKFLYYPYRYTNPDTSTIMKLDVERDDNHTIKSMYPSGFRTVVTKGIDSIVDKFLEEFPYPVVSEEMIVFNDNSRGIGNNLSCQIAHRLIASGWRMILIRPNSVFFPSLSTTIPKSEKSEL